ncbi:MAG TPA: OmpA family protein [Gemmatimonadaceae bacterium]|nr:OmpA family protein [Gemmatimonadaceae bacterium]
MSPTKTKTIRLSVALVAMTSLVAASGCATNAQTGGLIGAAAGAAAGGLIGNNNGGTAKGAIFGAAVGGAAGAYIGSRMDKQAEELAQNIPGAKVERVGEGIQVTFESGLLYDFDSDNMKPEARANLRELAASLKEYDGSELLIVGHTDATGSDSYNQSLSERRAAAARSYLIAQGVESSRVKTRGLGESEPVATNDTDAGRQANRRVEVAIYAGEELRREAQRP